MSNDEKEELEAKLKQFLAEVVDVVTPVFFEHVTKGHSVIVSYDPLKEKRSAILFACGWCADQNSLHQIVTHCSGQKEHSLQNYSTSNTVH